MRPNWKGTYSALAGVVMAITDTSPGFCALPDAADLLDCLSRRNIPTADRGDRKPLKQKNQTLPLPLCLDCRGTSRYIFLIAATRSRIRREAQSRSFADQRTSKRASTNPLVTSLLSGIT